MSNTVSSDFHSNVHTQLRTCRPFVVDLESTNHTQVNSETIPTTRFYELRAGDGTYTCVLLSIDELLIPAAVIKFGLSDREYVLLHDAAT